MTDLVLILSLRRINRSKTLFLTITERPTTSAFRPLLTKLNIPIVNIEFKTFLVPSQRRQ